MNEQELHSKFEMPAHGMSPRDTFQLLASFWHHFALHKRTCDKTGETIISVFDSSCPYPVWKRSEWLEHAAPPAAEVDMNRPFFEQLWELFQQSPIPHRTGAGSQNCEYTDDWWYSKNCYLCHSGVECEDVSYCYRTLELKDSQFCVFSYQSEISVDLINSIECFNTIFALNSRQCRDSAFLFDCRNCSDCLFSWNLRNKQYCIFNEQLTKEEYEKRKAEYDLSSRQQYEQAKKTFWDILSNKAWWKAVSVEQSEGSTGDFLEMTKGCENCYYVYDGEDCAHTMRSGWIKDNLYGVSTYKAELVYLSSMAQDDCFNIKCCNNVVQCKNMEYSMHCFNSKDCFGCCGLVGKQYHIFNKPYSKEDYEKKVAEIKAKMSQEGVYGQFFPKHFAACPYDESLAGFHWPLTPEQQQAAGFRVKESHESPPAQYAPLSDIPDRPADADESICDKVFWDEAYQRPFQITPRDLKYCQERGVPLPNSYYIHRLKDNFKLLFFNGELRETTCAQTGEKVMTGLPAALDKRILSREAYLKMMG